jgi:dinuclear metal center YbgI/SA1388 family protein
MTTVGDIYQWIDGFAPFSTAMDFDNAGLLAGSPETEVRRAVLSLDITPGVVREAAAAGAQLVVSHHPVIFSPLRKLRPGTAPYLLAQYGIAAVCAHTNLDLAPGGVNTCLAERLGLRNPVPAAAEEKSGLPAALAGETDRPFSPREFAESVRGALGCGNLFYADGGREITKVGLCSGSGCEYLPAAAALGCQAFVTGEAKHHELLAAKELGVTLVAAGHYSTEQVVIGPLLARLRKAFPAVEFLETGAYSCPAEFL